MSSSGLNSYIKRVKTDGKRNSRQARITFPIRLYSFDVAVQSTATHLARRGLKDRTELCAWRSGTKDLGGLIADGCDPPMLWETMRLTVCPVSRSIERIDSSSTGATIVM